MKRTILLLITIGLGATLALSQDVPATASSTSSYQPKFEGDKAHSNAEAAALGYMRTLVSAQKVYKKKHNEYAKSLMALVGSGSFTRRMAETKRGDYGVSFKPRGDGYSLALTPINFDAGHRAFYVDESGTFRCEADKPATASSPTLE